MDLGTKDKYLSDRMTTIESWSVNFHISIPDTSFIDHLEANKMTSEWRGCG